MESKGHVFPPARQWRVSATLRGFQCCPEKQRIAFDNGQTRDTAVVTEPLLRRRRGAFRGAKSSVKLHQFIPDDTVFLFRPVDLRERHAPTGQSPAGKAPGHCRSNTKAAPLLADLDADDLAGDDEFDATVLLSPRGSAVVGDRHCFAEALSDDA
jgi:hypothetical protein